MAAEEIVQIRVGNQTTGIVGLQKALEEMAGTLAGKPDGEIGQALVERLSGRNYIPGGLKSLYAEAFARQYRKFAGLPAETLAPSALEVKVLGAGCSRCHQLTQDLMAVMADTGIAADLEHVTDLRRIASYGVMGSPALLINGKVVSVGTVPSKSQLKTWLTAGQ